ncbi:hypothetical protein F5Y08DRAFT_110865 [Xylaria arbuscula]|nr:hypothetical protein F5Y08DRAFT_110865 [Xylaria arbuscula]
MVKFSPCLHCQIDNNVDNALECMGCNYHPWRWCHHPDCNKLPPIKHRPMRSPPPPPPPPPKEKKETKTDSEKDAENEKGGYKSC